MKIPLMHFQYKAAIRSAGIALSLAAIGYQDNGWSTSVANAHDGSSQTVNPPIKSAGSLPVSPWDHRDADGRIERKLQPTSLPGAVIVPPRNGVPLNRLETSTSPGQLIVPNAIPELAIPPAPTTPNSSNPAYDLNLSSNAILDPSRNLTVSPTVSPRVSLRPPTSVGFQAEESNRLAQPKTAGSGDWEGLPRRGMVLASNPGSTEFLSGLPDRTESKTDIVSLRNEIRSAIAEQASLSNDRVIVINPHARSETIAPAIDPSVERRQQIASQITQEMTATSPRELTATPAAIEPPVGWQTIEQELQEHLLKCELLLRRGAIQSSREEAIMGLRTLFRVLDFRRQAWTSEPALDLALKAFREESDFYLSGRSRGSRSVESIVATHTTPVLKGVQLAGQSPELAAQHYRGFANDQLSIAADQHPWASDLYYALGKTFEKESLERPNDRLMLQSQAAICYQVALEINPKQPNAGSQLGFVLLQLDRVEDAQQILQHAAEFSPSAAAFQNLAEAYRRSGLTDQQRWASNQALALSAPTSPMPKLPQVEQIAPEQFAGISPYNPWQAGTTAPAPVKTPSPATATGRASNSLLNFLR